MKKIFFILACFIWCSTILSAKTKKRVFVSFYPLEYATNYLAASDLEVWNPVDSDPAEWKPTRSQINEIRNCSLIIVNGAGFEKWVQLVSLPKEKVVVSTKPFKKSWLKYRNSKLHKHGNKAHIHKGYDGHTWLSPKLFSEQVKTIYTHLNKLGYVNKENLKKRYDELLLKFSSLNNRWRKVGKKLQKSGYVLTNHPAYNYLAKEYKFKVKNFNFNPEEKLLPSNTKEISKFLKENKGKYIFWEALPIKGNIDLLTNKFSLTTVVITPAETRSNKDFYDLMSKNVSLLEKI